MLTGQVSVGSSVSLTVTVKVQLLVLPLASVAVQVTVVTPLLKLVPLVFLMMRRPPRSSLFPFATLLRSVRTQVPKAVLVLMFDGQVNVGSSVSLTVTVQEQMLLLPLASLTVQVTVVTPLLKLVPLAGLQLTVEPGQLSLAFGTV